MAANQCSWMTRPVYNFKLWLNKVQCRRLVWKEYFLFWGGNLKKNLDYKQGHVIRVMWSFLYGQYHETFSIASDISRSLPSSDASLDSLSNLCMSLNNLSAFPMACIHTHTQTVGGHRWWEQLVSRMVNFLVLLQLWLQVPLCLILSVPLSKRLGVWNHKLVLTIHHGLEMCWLRMWHV